MYAAITGMKPKQKIINMTSEELQNELDETWYRNQSADNAHYSIWGEAFQGETVCIADIKKIIDAGLSLEEMIRQLREII